MAHSCFFNQPAFYLSDCHDQGSDSHLVTETMKIHTQRRATLLESSTPLLQPTPSQREKNKHIDKYIPYLAHYYVQLFMIITIFLLGNETLSLAPRISGHNLWNFMIYSFHNLYSKALFSVPPFLASVYMCVVCVCLPACEYKCIQKPEVDTEYLL